MLCLVTLWSWNGSVLQDAIHNLTQNPRRLFIFFYIFVYFNIYSPFLRHCDFYNQIRTESGSNRTHPALIRPHPTALPSIASADGQGTTVQWISVKSTIDGRPVVSQNRHQNPSNQRQDRRAHHVQILCTLICAARRLVLDVHFVTIAHRAKCFRMVSPALYLVDRVTMANGGILNL